ncbi:MAG: 30S ribosome-binding factor RbfA [bacterium JZ-2024 1]
MKPYRKEKLERIFRDEVARCLADMKDPRIGYATISRVVLTKDLKYLRVGISVLGGKKEKQLTMKALKHSQPFVKMVLRSRLDLRTLPEIHFVLDESFEEAARVYQILKNIEGESHAK